MLLLLEVEAKAGRRGGGWGILGILIYEPYFWVILGCGLAVCFIICACKALNNKETPIQETNQDQPTNIEEPLTDPAETTQGPLLYPTEIAQGPLQYPKETTQGAPMDGTAMQVSHTYTISHNS